MLLRYGTPFNSWHVIAYLGMVLRFIAAVFLVPFAISLVAREFDLSVSFGAVIAASALAGWLLGRRRPARVGRREAILVTALAYPLFAALGALALLPALGYVDGLFETMSGVTTTGLSVLDFVATPVTVVYFRAYTQWIGGAGIIVLSVVLLLGASRSAKSLFSSESKEENIVGSIAGTANVILRIYALLTAVGIVALMVAGMSPSDAFLHALASVSTGGFSPYADSVAHFHSVPIMAVLIVLMMASAVTLPLYYAAYRRGLHWITRDSQARSLLVFAVIGSIVFVFSGPLDATTAVRGVFNAVSALTTTGFSVNATAAWARPAFAVALVLMLMGGSLGSTAGGVKQFRVGVVLKMIGRSAVKPNLPEHAQVPLSYDGAPVTQDEIGDIVAVLGLFGVMLAVSTLLLTLSGATVANSIFEAASSLATVGLSSGITGPHAAGWVKGILMVDMWAGRLEMIPLAVLLANAQLFLRRRAS